MINMDTSPHLERSSRVIVETWAAAESIYPYPSLYED